MTLRTVGAGQAAAFTYDLARSIVYTRQGNPAWAGSERDFGIDALIRSDDLFFGAKPGDVQPDWVDLNKVAIPQADEQQRLLANLVTEMNADRMPLPRFWYLPRGEKAAVVMTGDDHGNGGTTGQFDRLQGGEPGRLLRRELGVHPVDVLRLPEHADRRAPTRFEQDGFEIALHLNTGCAELHDRDSLARQLGRAAAAVRASAFPTLDAPVTNRTHCIAWSDWASEPIVELRERRPARHELLLLAGRPGSRTARACSPARACRCASPTSTAR